MQKKISRQSPNDCQDVSLIPKSVGELLDFKIESEDKIDEIKGIGERGIPIVIKI